MTKVELALHRIKHLHRLFVSTNVFVGHSGGKDSCVILHLAKQVFPHIHIVHNVKPILGTGDKEEDKLTEMYPETLAFLYEEVCKKNTVTLMHSSKMEDYVRSKGFLCQIDGARVAEAGRIGKSANFIYEGQNINRAELPNYLTEGLLPFGIFGLHICYPIYDWEDEDVFRYLIKNQIPFSAEYENNGELKAFMDNNQL